MRSALLRFMAVAISFMGALTGCSTPTCRSANAAAPATQTMATPPQPIDVRFVVASSAGAVAHIDLLTTLTGHLAHDRAGHEILDPNVDPTRRVAATTVAVVHDFLDPTGAVTHEPGPWLDDAAHVGTRPRRDAGSRDDAGSLGVPRSRGRGIGATPVLPPSPPDGPFVAIGGASSFMRYALGTQDASDAGISRRDAGPNLSQRVRTWEWVEPTPTPMPGSTDRSLPALADLVVVRRQLPEHDLAFVARAAVRDMAGQVLSGGDLLVLDIDNPGDVIVLTTLTFNTYADRGLTAVPTALAYRGGLVYVALDHQSFFPMRPTYGPGMIAVVDPNRRDVRMVLHAPSFVDCTSIAPFNPVGLGCTGHPDMASCAGDTLNACRWSTAAGGRCNAPDPGADRRLVVTCRGTAPATIGTPTNDSGFFYIEYDPAHPVIAPTIAETATSASLGVPRPDGGSMPLYGRWIAYVSRGSVTPAYLDRLIAVNFDTGESRTLTTAPPASGTNIVGLGSGAFDPVSGVLVVPHGFEGVDTWQVPRAPQTLMTPHTIMRWMHDPIAVPITGCGHGHLASRSVRVVGGSAATVAPMPDAGMPIDAAPVDSASMDAGTPIDSGAIDARTNG